MPVCGEATLGDYTAEALKSQRNEFSIKKYSELCVLRASVVNILSQQIRKNHSRKVDDRYSRIPFGKA